jgi:HAMP domain-containing protein
MRRWRQFLMLVAATVVILAVTPFFADRPTLRGVRYE